MIHKKIPMRSSFPCPFNAQAMDAKYDVPGAGCAGWIIPLAFPCLLQLCCHHEAGSLRVPEGIWSRDCVLVSLAFCCKKSLIRLSFLTLSCLGFGMDLVSTLARWISSCALQLLLWPKLHILTSSASIVPKIATRLATSRHMIKFVGHVSANATYVRFPKGLQSNTQYYCLHLHMLYGWCV